MTLLRWLCLAALLFVAIPLLGARSFEASQLESSVDLDLPAQGAAIARLQLLLGRWEGVGWELVDGARQEFHGYQLVEQREGPVVVVESKFESQQVDLGAVGHDTSTHIVSFDPNSKKYWLREWPSIEPVPRHELWPSVESIPAGGAVEPWRRVNPRIVGWSWERRERASVERRVVDIRSGQWRETVERSRDGGRSWQTHLEKTLQSER